MYWGWCKHRYQEIEKNTFADAKAAVFKCLDSCPIDVIWKFVNRSWRFMDAYRKRLTGEAAAWAVKDQKGHRPGQWTGESPSSNFVPIVIKQTDREEVNARTVSICASEGRHTLWSDPQTYRIPCETQMKMIFTINDLAVTLDESTLVVNQNGQCTGIIQQWSSPLATEYFLGSRFLSSVYVYALLLPSSSSTGAILARTPLLAQSGFVQRKTGNTNGDHSTSAIVGVAVGSAAFAVLVLIADI
ncbi:hypothetical protein IW261DRAFT_1420346 [Armillaria novae-zelandiae]|uniref:Peptidase A1 domain-containing protein n=1 Tax=Armillaria novae-zelandiae TaxID=153914 RepID=A0AA39P5V4_9AGAR|nr:hypothetical protein IW261DRAFT_1420346 [Armillaria novae-zelandiae]